MAVSSYLYDAKGRDQKVELSAKTLKQIGKERLLWIDVDSRDPAELKAVAEAIEKAKIFKPACCQSLRYSFAVRLFENNHSVHTIQNLLGHKNLKTTMSYLHFNDSRGDVLSPLDN